MKVWNVSSVSSISETMTIENITRYLTKGDLLIVGDREDIQLLALEHNNAILVTGAFRFPIGLKSFHV